MLFEGLGGPPDEVEARRLFALAAEQGHPEAQASLGGLLAYGRGGAQDEVEARRLLRLAAEQGHPAAQ
eukprot:2949675-Prymnesium_polylepis.1